MTVGNAKFVPMIYYAKIVENAQTIGIKDAPTVIPAVIVHMYVSSVKIIALIALWSVRIAGNVKIV